MGASGWIKLDRQIRSHWVWSNHEYAYAWMDLLMMVNHESKKIHFNGDIITIRRGQVLTSVRKLSEQWGWNKDKTLRFLRLLEKDDMIRRDTETVSATLLTVVNWAKFQGPCDTNKDTHTDTNKDTHTPQTRKNKNNKNEKEYIAPPPSEDDEDDCYTQEEYDELCRQWRIDHGLV